MPMMQTLGCRADRAVLDATVVSSLGLLFRASGSLGGKRAHVAQAWFKAICGLDIL